jgi:hypothetical protein
VFIPFPLEESSSGLKKKNNILSEFSDAPLNYRTNPFAWLNSKRNGRLDAVSLPDHIQSLHCSANLFSLLNTKRNEDWMQSHTLPESNPTTSW